MSTDQLDRSKNLIYSEVWREEAGLAKVRQIVVEVPEMAARRVERILERMRGITLEAFIENQVGEMASVADPHEHEETEPEAAPHPMPGYA